MATINKTPTPAVLKDKQLRTLVKNLYAELRPVFRVALGAMKGISLSEEIVEAAANKLAIYFASHDTKTILIKNKHGTFFNEAKITQMVNKVGTLQEAIAIADVSKLECLDLYLRMPKLFTKDVGEVAQAIRAAHKLLSNYPELLTPKHENKERGPRDLFVLLAQHNPGKLLTARSQEEVDELALYMKLKINNHVHVDENGKITMNILSLPKIVITQRLAHFEATQPHKTTAPGAPVMELKAAALMPRNG